MAHSQIQTVYLDTDEAMAVREAVRAGGSAEKASWKKRLC